jgi:hypothetical protein
MQSEQNDIKSLLQCVHVYTIIYISNPRDIHPRPLEDIVAQHFRFALFVRRYRAWSQSHGGVGPGSSAFGESAWVDAEDRVDDLGVLD